MINIIIIVTYTHFGKQPDVLKHLVLCEVLQIEKPQIYVETNSACAIYKMTHTPEQEYGIYHFLNEANKDATLKNSLYYQLENESMANGNYLGSPALAMKVLNNDVKGCLFFDLENGVLDNIESFARHQSTIPPIKTFNCDSIDGVLYSLRKSSSQANDRSTTHSFGKGLKLVALSVLNVISILQFNMSFTLIL